MEQKLSPKQHLENTRKITKIILSLDENFELPNGWKLRELLIHLWSWDDQMINGCNAKLNGTCDDFKFDHQEKGMKYDKWNDVILEEKKDMSLKEVKKLFKDTREKVIKLFDKIISQPETIEDEKSMFRNENIATLWMHDKQHLEKGGQKIDF
ncbi:MAG: ClbS/DfsB family four-helix bundle protein [Asgard group archaeon]|nr:ClbS/DfsB family four-helix bundle protein [Asgard group archaeon]